MATIILTDPKHWLSTFIRSAFKEDLTASTAELVYSEPFRFAGEFLAAAANCTQYSATVIYRTCNSIASTHGSDSTQPASRHYTPGAFISRIL